MATPKYFIGNELFVYTDSSANPVAYATECSLSINANQIDTSNKQSGIWASAIAGQLSWSISASAIYTSDANYHDLYSKMISRNPVTVTIGCVQSLNSDASTYTKLDSSHYNYSGNAFITSMELQAGNGQVASFSVEFTGEGKLTESGSGLPTTIASS